MIAIIRHGRTKGNEQKRYIGITDEGLSAGGAALIKEMREAGMYPSAVKVFSSPLRRCIETAAIIYPDKKPNIISDLREMSFGEFEGLTFEEITQKKGYEDFGGDIDTKAFPGGEAFERFGDRCMSAFRELSHMDDIAVIAHGGVIMSIMHCLFGNGTYCYYDFWVDNGHGYAITRGESRFSYVKL